MIRTDLMQAHVEALFTHDPSGEQCIAGRGT